MSSNKNVFISMLKHIPKRWGLLAGGYAIGLTIFTLFAILMLSAAMSKINPNEALPWGKLLLFTIPRIAFGPVYVVIGFNPNTYLSGGPSWGQYVLQSALFLVLIFTMLFAHPIHPSRRTVIITILGITLWFLFGLSLVGLAVT